MAAVMEYSEYQREYGFIGYGSDPSNYTYVSVWDLLPNPIARHIEISGWGGLGMDFSRLVQLWPTFIWAAVFYYLRSLFFVKLRGLGIACGVPAKSEGKLRKFQYQFWLFCYYVLSSAFGYYVLQDKPWLGFPMTPFNQMSVIVDHPSQPDEWIVWYYCYEMGFYLSEMFVIFTEARRSDFVEYVAHHITTILLMVFSFIGYEHRIGTYILIIHDISDILLAFTKVLHYCKANEIIVNISFGLFVVVFFFMRLVCLPVHGFAVIFVATGKRICTVNFWLLTILLQFVLQGLHVYWFTLILRLLGRLLFSEYRDDIRSDSDDEAPPAAKDKKKDKKKEK